MNSRGLRPWAQNEAQRAQNEAQRAKKTASGLNAPLPESWLLEKIVLISTETLSIGL